MSRKLSTKNKLIRQEASKMLEGNAWSFFGATLIAGIIGSLVSFSEFFTDSQYYLLLFFISGVLYFVVSNLLNMGILWESITMVDKDYYRLSGIFKPFTQRPFRNILIILLYTLLFFFITILIFGIAILGTGLIMENTTGILDSIQGIVTTPSVASLDPQYLIAIGRFFGVSFLLTLLGFIPLTVIYYRYVLVQYIPFDNNETGPFQAFKVSATMMKGNKFKLFRIDFFYAFIIILFWVIAGIAVGLTASLFNSAIVTIILAIIFLLAGILISIILFLRAYSARALFYRLLTDEFGAEYDQLFPFLDMAPAPAETMAYQTQARPSFAEDTQAIEPGANVQSEKAANYDPEENNQAQSVAKTAGPAAAVFTAGQSDAEGSTEEQNLNNLEEEELSEELASDYPLDETKDHPVYSAVDDQENSTDHEENTDQENPDFEAYEDQVAAEADVNDDFVNLAADQTGVQDADLDQVDDQDLDKEDGQYADHESGQESSLAKQQADSAYEEKDETNIEKQPYNIMGYNTPERTDFSHLDKEDAYAADKAQTDDGSGVDFSKEDKED
ncbi:DUF975 family protein [Aerococcus kribbianus]|uniref:DUF975 family protein n=1 Tax=Aerococcus kribbianus TaxID=2999064 RepID=A0A9X3FQG4_9LACT|nr:MULTISPECIES: DUF975 family protein [unclassified Aerococcus]MCZ0718025.1 DUF975 family protein [Aerococcus sp. YH-aer221]MCZ0726406.1 DUF975 family protein [Aerococcus sp. YH-aer222]